MPLHIIHSDVWEAPHDFVKHFHFYVIVGLFFSFHMATPYETKFEVFVIFKNFQKLVENQFNTTIKIFQCEGGREFDNGSL